MSGTKLITLIIFLVELTAPCEINAQQRLGIFGTVTDPSPAPLREVTVTASSGQTERTVTTDQNGLYQFFGLPDGVYVLTFEKSGFQGGERHNVIVRAGQPPAREDKQLLISPPRRTRVAGTVVDPAGAASPGIEVSATNSATGRTYVATTNDQGEYTLEAEPGRYRFTFTASGFKSLTQDNVQITMNASNRVNATLDVGGISSTVDVVTLPPSTSIEVAHQITELPLTGRNFFNLLNLQPGVSSRASINGSRRDQANITMDGIQTNDQLVRSAEPAVSLNSVGEFRFSQTGAVSQAGFQSVQLNKSSGDQIDISTRSGSNNFHGEVDYQVINDALGARDFFNLSGFDTFRRHDFSVKLGGPIRKDKLFFFVNYDLARKAEAPTFSTILSSQISALNQQLRRLGLPGEDLRRFVTASASNSPLVRLDYNTGRQNSLAMIYSFRRTLTRKDLTSTRDGASSTPSTARDLTDRNHLFSLRYIRTFSPRMVSESSYVYQSNSISIDPVEPAEPSMLIPGVALLGRATSLIEGDGHRYISHVISERLTIDRGSHRMEAGGHFELTKNLFRFAAFESGRAVIPSLAALSSNVPTVDLFQLGQGGTQARFNFPKIGLYFEDAIDIKSTFSVNLGLRYKAELPPSTLQKETNGWQPKLGFAWNIHGTPDTVLRAGYTLYRSFLQPLPIAFQLLMGGQGPVAPARRVISIAGQQAASSAFNQFLTGGNVPTGRQMAITYDPSSRSPFVHALDVSLSRSLTRNMAFDISYALRLGRHLLTSTNINLPSPVLINGRPDFRNASVNPDFTQIYRFGTTGHSSYHSGSVSVFRRFSKGFGFNAGYTFSKAIDDVPSLERVDAIPIGSFEATPENAFDPGNERAISAWNPTHRFRAWTIWEVPQADRQKASRLRRALGTLFFSKGLLLESGRHLNVTVGSDVNHDGNPLTDRPLTVGRNTFVGQGRFQLDIRTGSNIRLTENQRLRLSVQIFNVLNRTNFATYNMVLGQSDLSGLDPNIVFGSRRLQGFDFRRPLTRSGFGLGTSTFGPRRVQLEVSYQF